MREQVLIRATLLLLMSAVFFFSFSACQSEVAEPPVIDPLIQNNEPIVPEVESDSLDSTLIEPPEITVTCKDSGNPVPYDCILKQWYGETEDNPPYWEILSNEYLSDRPEFVKYNENLIIRFETDFPDSCRLYVKYLMTDGTIRQNSLGSYANYYILRNDNIIEIKSHSYQSPTYYDIKCIYFSVNSMWADNSCEYIFAVAPYGVMQEDANVIGTQESIITINDEKVKYNLLERLYDDGTKDLIDKSGDLILERITNYALRDETMMVRRNSKWGLYDLSKKQLIVDYLYDDYSLYPSYEKETVISVKQGWYWGVINGSGRIIIEPVFNSLQLIGGQENAHYIKVRSSEKYGLYTDDGVLIMNPEYDALYVDSVNYPSDCIFVKSEVWGGALIKDIDNLPEIDWSLKPSFEEQLKHNNWQFPGHREFYTDVIANGQLAITSNLRTFFLNYGKYAASQITFMPSFDKGKPLEWNNFITLAYRFFSYENRKVHIDRDLTDDDVDRILTKYLVNPVYQHQSSLWFKYNNGIYKPMGFDLLGTYLTDVVEFDRTVDAEGNTIYKATLHHYYLGEDVFQYPDGGTYNEKAVWKFINENHQLFEDMHGDEVLEYMIINGLTDTLKPNAIREIEFLVKEPLDDIYFKYFSCNVQYISPYS